ncbi:MAG: 50S ribosomal protein L11 methyltransferase, partial [Chitinophagaceae bacterium]
MSDYFEIAITVENEDQKNQLVALLSDIGFEGFQEDNKILLAYAAVDDFDQVMMESILKTYNLSYLQSVIKPKNWNEEWEAGFEPVIIHDFCAIRASFHSPVAGVSHEIIITPKMSFGTGHHATTYMMIEAMSVLNFTGMKVLDFGTGTGVLAILASKMGAAVIEAVDYDEWSIENGRENIVRNNCSNISL